MHDADRGAALRRLVVGLKERTPLVNGGEATAVNFDNAATTPPLAAVLREINAFAPWYSSVHRGGGYKSMVSSELYESGRRIVREFVGADPGDAVIYTKNTTEAINLLSAALAQSEPGKTVLATRMEHLANDLPWRAAHKTVYAEVDESGRLDLDDLEDKLKRRSGNVKLVAVSGASNVTGYMNPVHKIARLAHRHGARVLVDGAQLAPHCPVDMKRRGCPEHIDYLVFSAHKMYAPFGLGVLVGDGAAFAGGAPYCKGGGAVKLVADEFVEWEDPPYKEEAGTPNLMGVTALLTAIRTLRDLGMAALYERERRLIAYIEAGLAAAPGVELYGRAAPAENKVGILSFRVRGIGHHLTAKILSLEAGVAVRSGLFCAHPYVQRLLRLSPDEIESYHAEPKRPFPGLVRASVGFYNTYEEADRFIRAVENIARHTRAYINKYGAPPSGRPPLCPGRRRLP